MLWCQGAQNIELFNYNLNPRKVHRVIKMHARPRQTDGQTDEHHGIRATIRSNERIAR